MCFKCRGEKPKVRKHHSKLSFIQILKIRWLSSSHSALIQPSRRVWMHDSETDLQETGYLLRRPGIPLYALSIIAPGLSHAMGVDYCCSKNGVKYPLLPKNCEWPNNTWSPCWTSTSRQYSQSKIFKFWSGNRWKAAVKNFAAWASCSAHMW